MTIFHLTEKYAYSNSTFFIWLQNVITERLSSWLRHYQQCNRDYARLRAPCKHAPARLKPWRILHRARCSTNRISRTVTAIHTP
ncbi:hypothetical protein [Streptomyces klenkii]|uniref:hypothetical protein n=1 Tax=Streptomyces klenkii TaxID=1420899 RepID=UPI003F4BDC96